MQNLQNGIRQSTPSLIVIVFFFVAMFLYSQLAGPLPLSITSTVTNKSDVFTVSGEGEAVAKPDIAYVIIGISENASTVSAAQSALNQKNSNIVSALNSANVDTNKDVKTSSYNINPNYDYRSGSQRITGYQASTNLRVTVRDIDNVNAVIDAATSAGANQVSNIQLDIDDKEALRDEARKEAVEEAKRKAQAAASSAGFKLGRIVSYSESPNVNTPQPYFERAVALDSAAEELPTTDIQTGTNEIKMTVSLGFELK